MKNLIENPPCPVCSGTRLRYVEFVYHCHPIDSAFDGGINLSPEEETSEFETSWDVKCLDCATVFTSATLFTELRELEDDDGAAT